MAGLCFGIVGLGVMGENLALNVEGRGFWSSASISTPRRTNTSFHTQWAAQ
jgi:6-phosphogluconate dehydrogenase